MRRMFWPIPLMTIGHMPIRVKSRPFPILLRIRRINIGRRFHALIMWPVTGTSFVPVRRFPIIVKKTGFGRFFIFQAFDAASSVGRNDSWLFVK